MRLTLRTLLAYLDDTLDREQTRQIGQKVAESDVARELIDRIRKVSRKRSLGVPAGSGPDKADPNTVAEYLDNDLPNEKVGEVEERALNSDTHLAEIAACHQLLTLILTEPAKVPPTARQRMYGLVKGPESDPTRRAPRVAPATLAADDSAAEEPDAHPLVSRRGGHKRLIAAGVLAALFGLTVWAALAPRGEQPVEPLPAAVVARNEKPADPKSVEQPKAAPAELAPAEKAKDVAPPVVPDRPKAEPPAPAPGPDPAEVAKARQPSDERREVGGYTSANSVLLKSITDRGPWKRVAPNEPLTGTTPLMALPALPTELRLGAVTARLCGASLEALWPTPTGSIVEAVAVPYQPPAGFDADLRLDHGRVYLKSSKPGAKVRLRTGEQLFDITLADDKTEVVVEQSRDGAGFLGVPQGAATVRVNLQPEVALNLPGPATWVWTVAGPVAQPEHWNEPDPRWSETPKGRGPVADAEAIRVAARRIGDPKVEVPASAAVELKVHRAQPAHTLGLFILAALDDVIPILDVLQNTDTRDRPAAVRALDYWASVAGDATNQLAGILTTKFQFTPAQAATAVALLYSAPPEGKTVDALFQAMREEKLLIREMAYTRLAEQEPTAVNRFNPADSLENRERALQDITRRINEARQRRPEPIGQRP